MNGLRRAYVLSSNAESGGSMMLTKRYVRKPWAALKAGDIVVLVEPDGTLVDEGLEHHLIEDPWVEPELGIHAFKSLDPCMVVHKEASNVPVDDEAGKNPLRGAAAAGLPAKP
jgi:hypothetical protein